MSTKFDTQFIQQCKLNLLKIKAELLNQISQSRFELQNNNKNVGDEIDQSVAFIFEHQILSQQNRLREKILEVEIALKKIEDQNFGICEETELPIEKERLALMPFTRLSIEGAEIRESLQKKFFTQNKF